ncbi:MAG: crossover junction endodeoxyribonuclease RuvC [bacterium]|nr:crossover junction endodeoxyribonuclease RuvC [bacterium]
MRILGIDPGSAATGFGVIDQSGNTLIHVTHGVLRPKPGSAPADRLAHLHTELVRVLAEFEPDTCAVERIFVAANPRSALVLGQARGVALAALGTNGGPVHEISAREVKKALVGTGNAAKPQVQAMVKRLLELPKAPPTDAADALAIAICQAHAGKLAGLGVRTRRGRRRPSTRAHFASRNLR